MTELTNIFSLLGCLWLVAYIYFGLELALGNNRLTFMSRVPPTETPERPIISIIIPACNEAKTIESALQTVLTLDYPEREVIVINDRSTDGTGEILDRMAQEYAATRSDDETAPVFRVIHIDTLPPGWLGKNHALYTAARQAAGDFLLFTDADIHYHPTALRRTVNYIAQNGIDHLVALPELQSEGNPLNRWLMDAMYETMAVFFTLSHRPWRVRDPESRYYIGVGAFNMVRKTAYEAIDGHKPIALCADDDVKLGKLLKQAGFRQDVLMGRDMITVSWYASPGEFVRGLLKNNFAFLNYSLFQTARAVFAILFLHVLPFALLPFALVFSEGYTRWIYLLILLTMVGFYWNNTRYQPASLLSAFGFPLAAGIFAFAMVASAWKTLNHGGITWRGTFYPLAELKANRI